MNANKTMVCAICSRNEKERPIFPVSTFKHIDERYEFPSEYEREYLCVKCAKSHFMNGFLTHQMHVSKDFHYNHHNYYDVVNLTGLAHIIEIKEGMYVLKFESSYAISPDLNEEDFENEDAYWEARLEGEKEIPVSILVFINGKNIVGKGSYQYRELIEDLIDDYKYSRKERFLN